MPRGTVRADWESSSGSVFGVRTRIAIPWVEASRPIGAAVAIAAAIAGAIEVVCDMPACSALHAMLVAAALSSTSQKNLRPCTLVRSVRCAVETTEIVACKIVPSITTGKSHASVRGWPACVARSHSAAKDSTNDARQMALVRAIALTSAIRITRGSVGVGVEVTGGVPSEAQIRVTIEVELMVGRPQRGVILVRREVMLMKQHRSSWSPNRCGTATSRILTAPLALRELGETRLATPGGERENTARSPH